MCVSLAVFAAHRITGLDSSYCCRGVELLRLGMCCIYLDEEEFDNNVYSLGLALNFGI